ncbi:septum site-determining protein MinD [Aetokthonos hydrillicola Thurmond2011]|jgi:septum site-determining protein MinD|uniref:Septum site-determining protein MinD n=1 Tax=Aetokthonos hydrillicola Thurmond2011 TaxID=2712845 RepID=A0AAP5IEX7_9CYAN|nr:septum site-determining protein MinD [Aetokthonos hydrillicola]MBO3457913.1 septum site-determining protein MinD [Aetokthonos hydrillicola CCALA 1050]MBW4587400.1 septum site-determining protein MinD [Aetokthonos hydrillicola CCALA 1050]MDR9899969.1 septum site-determining protein MinD [Aetokthonos hydrillicola Thurmond2011]
MTRIIVITSGKGGVGKTTVTANLGMALAKKGHQVALIDADFNLRNLDLLLGLEKRIVYGALDFLAGECRIEQALVKDKRQPRLVLLPVSQKCSQESVKPEQMKSLVDALAQRYEYVLIDCPAGIEMGFQNAIAPASEALIVTTPEIPAVRDADRTLKLLEEEGIRKIELIINRVKPLIARLFNLMTVQDVQELLGIPLFGVIPEDESVIVSINQGEPLALAQDKSKTAIAFDNIASRLQGKTVEFLDFEGLYNELLETEEEIDPTTSFANLCPYF